MSVADSKSLPATEAPRRTRARVHLRMNAVSKRTLERAAAYEGITVNRFVLSSAIAAAERVIESKEKVVLSATDWDTFHDALLNPPQPKAVLSAATRRYRERVGE